MDKVLFGRKVDAPLDAHGEQQAQALARGFPALDPEQALIEASPRRRTQQTAHAIAARFKCEVLTAPVVDEMDFGDWCGRSFTQLATDPAWRDWNEQRSRSRTPAGDSIAAVQARVLRHLHHLCAAFPACTIAIVTHAEIIRATLLHCLGLSADDYGRIDVQPASMTFIQQRRGSARASFEVTAMNASVPP